MIWDGPPRTDLDGRSLPVLMLHRALTAHDVSWNPNSQWTDDGGIRVLCPSLWPTKIFHLIYQQLKRWIKANESTSSHFVFPYALSVSQHCTVEIYLLRALPRYFRGKKCMCKSDTVAQIKKNCKGSNSKHCTKYAVGIPAEKWWLYTQRQPWIQQNVFTTTTQCKRATKLTCVKLCPVTCLWRIHFWVIKQII